MGPRAHGQFRRIPRADTQTKKMKPFLCVCGRSVENIGDLIERTGADFAEALANETDCDCGAGIGSAFRTFDCNACGYPWLIIYGPHGSKVLPFSADYRRLLEGRPTAS